LYVHDNKSVAQSSNTNTPNPISNYLAVPGTGEVLAFGSTAGGTTNTHPGRAGLGDWAGKFGKSVTRFSSLYDPFGHAITVGQVSAYPYLFRGMEYDATALYNARGIYYSQNLGRPQQQVTPGGPGGGQDRDKRFGPFSPGSGGGLGGN
jgi:hypothetical protein